MVPAWALAMMEDAAPAWSPLDLGGKLIAWWAPPHGGNTTQGGGTISSWRDEVGGYDLSQAASGEQPAYSATGMAGLPCAVFDGASDFLTLAPVPASFPTSGAGETWVSCSQDEPAASAGQRMVFGFGAQAGSNQRIVLRLTVSGVNRAQAIADGVNALNTSVDFTGAHLVRARYGATIQVDVDGVAGASAPITPTTANVRVRMGSDQMDTAGRFWKGAVRQVLVTAALTADEATALADFMTI